MKKRGISNFLAIVAIAALVGAPRASCAATPTSVTTPAARLAVPALPITTPLIAAVDSIGITVASMDRSLAFYIGVLGFEQLADREVAGDRYEHLYGVFGARVRSVRLRLGDEHLELMQFLAPRGRPVPADSRSNDHWFQHVAIIVSDMARAYAHLRERGVEHASTGPQRLPDWNPNAGGIEAFYFRDPDGHTLEILAFPAGKGAVRWQRKDGPLFLGIDHTAIVVADTAASLGFYRDRLGLVVAGNSENYGPEQERLNNVFGARLRITSLRAAEGPAVELLEYLAPRTGRPMPLDTSAGDLWYWQINFRSKALAQVEAALRGDHAEISSGSVVRLPDRELGYGDAMTVRDPDRHAALVLQAAP